jgi:hypothetical protein
MGDELTRNVGPSFITFLGTVERRLNHSEKFLVRELRRLRYHQVVNKPMPERISLFNGPNP